MQLHQEHHVDQLEMVKEIREKEVKGQLGFIAISGFGGSGKSTFSGEIRERLDQCEVVPIDDFIIGRRDERSSDWSTFDRNRLHEDILKVARPNVPLSYKIYNSGEWVAGKGGISRTITPQKFLIVEGCGILHPDLMPYYDYSVWIGQSGDTAWEKAKTRDRSEGNNNDQLWDEIWGPNDIDYFNKYRPDQLATAIIDPSK